MISAAPGSKGRAPSSWPSWWIAGLGVALGSHGCGNKIDLVPVCDDFRAQDASVDYYGDIERIIHDTCQECHHSSKTGLDRKRAPNGADFDDLVHMREYCGRGSPNCLEKIVAKVEVGDMPPDNAERDLSFADRCKVIRWGEEGYQTAEDPI